MADPVSWLLIEQGWQVVASDGTRIGTVAQVEGDKQADIFDGLAVDSGDPAGLRYAAAEQVTAITPGTVTLAVARAEDLPPFEAPPAQTTWRPGKEPLLTRLGNLLRGKR